VVLVRAALSDTSTTAGRPGSKQALNRAMVDHELIGFGRMVLARRREGAQSSDDQIGSDLMCARASSSRDTPASSGNARNGSSNNSLLPGGTPSRRSTGISGSWGSGNFVRRMPNFWLFPKNAGVQRI
jgi:hypothetical protein